MARQASKIMSIAEKKVAQAGLKTAMKTHSDSVKALDTQAKLDTKTLAEAQKLHNTTVAAAKKAYDAAVKDAGKALADAQKVAASASAKTLKLQTAAAKGTEKLTSQIAELDAVAAAPVNAKSVAKEAIAKASSKQPALV